MASDFDYLAADGDRRRSPAPTSLRVEAPTRLLLTAERSALNLLCHLSGVATLTRRVGRRPRRHRRASARHAQDHARRCALLEKYAGALWWRGQPPHVAQRRGTGEGQPRVSRSAAWPRVRRGAVAGGPGANLWVLSGGSANGASVSAGYVSGSLLNGTVEVFAGGLASGTHVGAGGIETVFSGGVASGTVVTNGANRCLAA